MIQRPFFVHDFELWQKDLTKLGQQVLDACEDTNVAPGQTFEIIPTRHLTIREEK